MVSTASERFRSGLVAEALDRISLRELAACRRLMVLFIDARAGAAASSEAGLRDGRMDDQTTIERKSVCHCILASVQCKVHHCVRAQTRPLRFIVD